MMNSRSGIRLVEMKIESCAKVLIDKQAPIARWMYQFIENNVEVGKRQLRKEYVYIEQHDCARQFVIGTGTLGLYKNSNRRSTVVRHRA